MFEKKLSIIAEIGVNHEGSFEKALELLKEAASCGADFIKFQSYTPSKYASAVNKERLERVSKFSLTKEQFEILSKTAHDLGVGFLSTPLTEDWVEHLDPLCDAFKIASGDITFKPVIKQAVKTKKPLIISTGGATVDEIDRAVSWVEAENGKSWTQENLILMQCVSAYPTPIDQANILSIPFLRDRYKVKVGYSNHVLGMNACLAAVAHGTHVVEVHFTDCKEGRDFRDHELSFDAKDLKEFVWRANEVQQSLGIFEKEVQPCETEGRSLMRKGIVAAKDLKAGEVLTSENLMYARPATEFTSNEIDLVLGKTIKEDIPAGFLITKKAV